jgi:hypothetical protein
MFLLRSAFWLGLAFMVMMPHGTDLGASAGALSAQAMAAGEKLIVEQIGQVPCSTIKCAGSQAMIAALITSTPSAGTPMHQTPVTTDPVPVPRPRPDRAG